MRGPSGAWLGEQTRPVSAPARRLLLPTAPSWAVLALAASLFVGLATADVALLGEHTAAEVVRVDRDDDSCTVGWDGGAQRAAVDCDTTDVRSGDRIRITALPWPFLGEAVNTRTFLSVVAVLGGGLGLLGLGGALMVNPLACGRCVWLARRARPTIPPRAATGGEAGEDRRPALDDDRSYATLAAAARHGDLYTGPGQNGAAAASTAAAAPGASGPAATEDRISPHHTRPTAQPRHQRCASERRTQTESGDEPAAFPRRPDGSPFRPSDASVAGTAATVLAHTGTLRISLVLRELPPHRPLRQPQTFFRPPHMPPRQPLLPPPKQLLNRPARTAQRPPSPATGTGASGRAEAAGSGGVAGGGGRAGARCPAPGRPRCHCRSLR
jgi:hypothetical protein